MKEIKFRAWDNYRKAMSYEVDIYCEDGIVWWVAQWRGEDGGKIEAFDSDGKGNVLMQFTGLKDRNGKEIYEGDIVRHHLGDSAPFYGGVICKVMWWEQGWHLSWEPPPFAVSNPHPFTSSEFFEVIGNIYENPELLK